MRLIPYDGLPAKGIHYSKSPLRRLEAAGRFPKRVLLGAARHAWLEEELDDWIRQRAAARNARAS